MGAPWRRLKNRLGFCADCGAFVRRPDRIIDCEGTMFCDDGCYNP